MVIKETEHYQLEVGPVFYEGREELGYIIRNKQYNVKEATFHALHAAQYAVEKLEEITYTDPVNPQEIDPFQVN